MTIARYMLCIVGGACLATCLCLYLACRDHGPYFKTKKGKLAAVGLSQPREEGFSRHRLSLRSDSGLKVEAALLLPNKKELPAQRYPAVVLLAGLDTGKDAVDYVSDIPGVIIAAIDYPYSRQYLDTAAKVTAELLPLRKAALNTVPSVMLLLDYLTSRTDVDSSRVILVGLSMGATFVPCIGVEDRRVKVAVMAFGGGDMREIIYHNLRSFCSEMGSDLLGYAGALLLRPIEPMRYADRISPTPLLMINGTRDEMIPLQCTDKFFQKANAPKKLIWLDAPHIKPGDAELTRQIVETLKRELHDMKILPALEPSPQSPAALLPAPLRRLQVA